MAEARPIDEIAPWERMAAEATCAGCRAGKPVVLGPFGGDKPGHDDSFEGGGFPGRTEGWVACGFLSEHGPLGAPINGRQLAELLRQAYDRGAEDVRETAGREVSDDVRAVRAGLRAGYGCGHNPVPDDGSTVHTAWHALDRIVAARVAGSAEPSLAPDGGPREVTHAEHDGHRITVVDVGHDMQGRVMRFVVAREPGGCGDAMYQLTSVVRVLRRLGDDRFWDIDAEDPDVH